MFNSVLLQIVTNGAATVAQVVDTAKNVVAQMPLPAAIQPKEDSLSLLDLIMKGGYIMIPIGLLSILTIYFFFERFMVISKAAKMDKNFMNSIKDFVHHGNLDAAKSLCKNTTAPAARMIEKGISRIGKPIKEIESSLGWIAAGKGICATTFFAVSTT